MLLIFVPFFVPIFATMLARWLPPYQKAKEHYILNAVLMTGVIAAMIHYVPSRDFLQKKVEKDYPVHALQYLDSHHIPGPMLNNYAFGGYFVRNGRETFIDGRGDLFERAGVLSDFVSLVQLKPGALTVLDRYKIQSCLLMKEEPLTTVLTASPNWERVYIDGTAALFVRKVPSVPRTK
jgi:hypothetical protein